MTAAVRRVAPAAEVDIDLASGRVRIVGDAEPDPLIDTIRAEGYEAQRS